MLGGRILSVITMAAQRRNKQAEALRKQQGGLAEFGQYALRTDDIQKLLQRATELVSGALQVDLVKILELQPGGQTLLVRAGVNWGPGVVGHATIEADSGSQAGYALETREPVITPDIEREKRYRIPQLLRDRGVRSTVNVIIRGESEPYGILEVDAQSVINFTEDEVNFLQNYANLIAGAIDRVSAHEKIRLMMFELQHRTKNMMVNIQAIARRIGATSTNFREFEARFDDRLRAMARAQDILLAGKGDAVGLRELLRSELGAHGASEGPNIILKGHHIEVPGEHVWGLGLIFHELTTNAQKYGALARPDATLIVSWDVDGAEKQVTIHWQEKGIRINESPSHKGFGSLIIEKAMPQTLGGSATLNFQPDGIEYTLRYPALASS